MCSTLHIVCLKNTFFTVILCTRLHRKSKRRKNAGTDCIVCKTKRRGGRHGVGSEYVVEGFHKEDIVKKLPLGKCTCHRKLGKFKTVRTEMLGM